MAATIHSIFKEYQPLSLISGPRFHSVESHHSFFPLSFSSTSVDMVRSLAEPFLHSLFFLTFFHFFYFLHFFILFFFHSLSSSSPFPLPSLPFFFFLLFPIPFLPFLSFLFCFLFTSLSFFLRFSPALIPFSLSSLSWLPHTCSARGIK